MILIFTLSSFVYIQHNSDYNCWIIVGNDKTGGAKVYDVTKYLDDHPGGREIMMEFAGTLHIFFISIDFNIKISYQNMI